jgi:hypothetical protein
VRSCSLVGECRLFEVLKTHSIAKDRDIAFSHTACVKEVTKWRTVSSAVTDTSPDVGIQDSLLRHI